jgi:transcriptional regulator with GAF, ATPase, and Fis domain
METLREEVTRIAAMDEAVLVHGENGSGKEVVAQRIYEQSPRNQKPFIKVNVATLPDTLIDGMLFGWEKGAFTNANQAGPGLFSQADGGTLLLDEIGELPLQHQPKFLRALEAEEVIPIGPSFRTIKVDVRIIAATNRDLKAMVKQGTFREDLYHRLSVVRVKVPALRDHLEDVEELAAHFLDGLCTTRAKRPMKFDPEAVAACIDFPGLAMCDSCETWCSGASSRRNRRRLRPKTSKLS